MNGRLNQRKIQLVDSTVQQQGSLIEVKRTCQETIGETSVNPLDATTVNLPENESDRAISQPVSQSTSPQIRSPELDIQSIDPQIDKSQPSIWRWLFNGLVLCCALGSLAALAFVWLTSLPPRTNCEEISPLSADIDRLYCAQAAAESGELSDLMAGLKLVEDWSPDNPLYNESRRWMEEWSQSVLMIARQKMAASDMEGAIELANRIPRSSPLYADAQARIAQWQENWQIDEAIYAKAENALKNQDWNRVSQHILELSESPYDHWNSTKVNELSQRVLAEKRARQTLAQAKRLAQVGAPADLRAALNLSKTLDPTTFTWAEAQPLFTQWGETLLTVGFNYWHERRFDEAIDYAESVSVSSALATEAQHLIDLSKARQLALASSTNWKPHPKHVWNLMEAVSAARQIPADSRFYAQAQESLASWEAQLNATTQLQYARVLADLGQRDMLQSAIAQAEQIAPNHPRRLQAQTLVAHWKQEVQRVEDQPYLLFAQQLSESGTIADLKLAIAEANKVVMGRALRGKAQGLIHDWTQQIQVLEDQPLLAEATTQAQRGNLTEAIRIAAQIPSGRALYYEAQAAIGGWQVELDRVELARTRSTQRYSETSADDPATDSSPENRNDRDTIPWIDETPSAIKVPKVESSNEVEPRPLPSAPPQAATRRLPEPETPTPFVLEENAPLFEEPPPQVEYDVEDIPILIRRRNRASHPEPTVTEPPATSDVFPPLDDASLFEESPVETTPAETAPVEMPPVLNTAPVEAEPIVEELPTLDTEASSIEPLLPPESSQAEEGVPLSMESIEKDVSDVSVLVEEEFHPVSMNQAENEVESLVY